MTKALHNAVGRISTALGLAVEYADGDGEGENLEPGLGDPLELVPVHWSSESKALLTELYCSLDRDPRALDLPYLAQRVDAEGDRTARGRRRLEEWSRLHATHAALLQAQPAAVPWGTGPRTIDLEPADYGLLPSPSVTST